MPVRLLSYNVRSLRDDAAEVAEVIRGCRPDLVCLQEVPRFAGWRVRRHRLARRCGLRVVAGRRAAGLAVLAGPRVTPLHRAQHLLSRVPGLHRRGLAVAVVEVAGRRLIAASTHLDLAQAPRSVHAAEILALLDEAGREHDAPVVLAGDINEEPGGAAWRLLTGVLRDAHGVAPAGGAATFSARNPRRRLDGVFTGPPITVTGCGVPEDPELCARYPRASDHRPVLADLLLDADS